MNNTINQTAASTGGYYYTSNPNYTYNNSTRLSQVVTDPIYEISKEVIDKAVKEVSDKVLKDNGVLEILLESIGEKVEELLETESGKKFVAEYLESKLISKIDMLRDSVMMEINLLRQELMDIRGRLNTNEVHNLPYTLGSISNRLNSLEDYTSGLNAKIEYEIGKDKGRNEG